MREGHDLFGTAARGPGDRNMEYSADGNTPLPTRDKTKHGFLQDFQAMASRRPPGRASAGAGAAPRAGDHRRAGKAPVRLAGWGGSVLLHVLIITGFIFAYHFINIHRRRPPRPLFMPVSFAGEWPLAKDTPRDRPGAWGRVARRDIPGFDLRSRAMSLQSPTRRRNGQTAARQAILLSLGYGEKMSAVSRVNGWNGDRNGALGVPARWRGSSPPVCFFGTHSRATSVVFLVDHSGSMIGKLHLVKDEVRRALDRLLPFEKFAVIVFSRHYQILGPSHLLPATVNLRRWVEKSFQRILAEGHNDHRLLPFLRPFQAAYAMRPQVIYFLTDGHFDPRLIPAIAALNATASARVYTFAFLDRNPVFQARLRRIAAETGGKFEVVSRRRLSLMKIRSNRQRSP
jgi:hypothetical protein